MKPASLFLVAVWLIMAGAVLGLAAEDDVAKLFQAGQQSLRERQFAQAMGEFQKVLALEPGLVEAEVNLGLAYQGLLDYEAATRYLAKALQKRPDLPGPMLIVGLDYLKLGLPQKAVPYLRRSLNADSSNIDAREALANAYVSLENFSEAAEQFRQIAALNSGKSDAWFQLGHQYLNLAARLAFRGSHLYRDSPWGHRFLGDLLLQRERWDDASKEYRKALGIDPQQRGLHSSIGVAYLRWGKLGEAEAEFRQELQLAPKGDPALQFETELAWLGLADAQLAGGQALSALNALQKAWDLSPEFMALQKEFPSVDLSANSIKTSAAAVDNQGESAAKHFLLARLFASIEESALAEREWRSFQDDFAAWQKTAAGAAIQNHVRSLKSQKILTDTGKLLLGKTQYALQQFDGAAEVLGKIAHTSVESAEASYWLERTYQAQGAGAYAKLQELYPGSWRAHQLRAEGYALRGDLPEALKEYGAALKLQPDNAELHEALGELYLDHHDKEAAQNELQQTLGVDSSRVHALYLLGRLYVEGKENDKAIPFLKKAVSLQPNLAEANNLLGTAYLRLGQYSEALPSLEKAASADPYGNVHFQLSVAYRKLGQPERAQKELALWKELRQSSLERERVLVMGSSGIETETVVNAGDAPP